MQSYRGAPLLRHALGRHVEVTVIPDTITRKHILRALTKIDSDGVAPRRGSTGWDLRYRGKKYPPKYVVSLAYVWTDGTELGPDRFHGGAEVNNFLIARGFEIVDKKGKPVQIEPVDEDDSSEFWEGRESFERHRRIERNPKLCRTAKRKRLRIDKNLRCDVCSFSFRERFGVLGVGFIEAHHTKPVSEMKGHAKVRVEDIALVCSNCHRMLHRSKPMLKVAQLRKRLRNRVA